MSAATAGFAVVQMGGTVYGIGDTEELAVRDAQQWMREGTIVLRYRAGASSVDGEMNMIPATARLLEYIRNGGANYALVDGVADHPHV